jgi:hypothetical protein
MVGIFQTRAQRDSNIEHSEAAHYSFCRYLTIPAIVLPLSIHNEVDHQSLA